MKKNELQTQKSNLTHIIVIVLSFIVCIAYFAVKSDDFLTYVTDPFESTGLLPEISFSDEYIQQIKCDNDGLQQIRLCFSTLDRRNYSRIFVSLTDSYGNVLDEWILDSSLLNDNDYRSFALSNRIEDSRNNTYFIRIRSDAEIGRGVCLYYNDSADHGMGLSHNGQVLSGELCYQVEYKFSFFRLFDRANGFHVIIVLLLSAVLFISFYGVRSIAIENRFLIIWIIISLMYFFSMTLFRVPDEENHFFRAFELSEFNVLTGYDSELGWGVTPLPIDRFSLQDLERDWQSFSDNKDKVVLSNTLTDQCFPNTAVYSPLSYIPQIIGFMIASGFTNNVAVIVYTGRILNWLFITALLYISIHLCPYGKGMIALIALIPMNIHESVSLAPDGMVVALSILMMTYVMYIRYEKRDTLSVLQIAVLYIIVLLISLIKLVYLPLGLLYLLIPSERFGNLKNKALNISAMAVMALGTNLVWLKICTRYLVFTGTDSLAQLSYLIRHMGDFLIVLFRTLFSYGDKWMAWMIGSYLGELNVIVVDFLAIMYICLISNRFVRMENESGDTGDRFVNNTNGIIVASITLLILLSLYFHDTPVYNNTIVGIQGRYFIPLLLPLYWTIHKPSLVDKIGENDYLSSSEYAFIACINTCSCIALLFSCMRLEL